jgi:sugar O-acyltransferase (sialic acid O-acetyltransferase NeuD family)
MSNLLILGAGGHAQVLAETALISGAFSGVAFLDDQSSHPAGTSGSPNGPVLGPLGLALEAATQQRFSAACVGIGNAGTRLHWLEQLKRAGYALPAVIHPRAWVSPSAAIGPGSVVFAHAAVQAQAQVGAGVILNTGCTVDHNSALADGVHICPGAHLAGEVKVGARSWIGIGAAVIQQVRIGSAVTVGAGAAVVRDLPDGVTAVGVPAHILPRS